LQKVFYTDAMELSITLAAAYEVSTLAELIEQVCKFVQEEIRSPSLPPLPIFTLHMENGAKFTGVPLRVTGKDATKFITLISSDPIERPITTVIVPFLKIQSIQVDQSESILGILMKRDQTAYQNLKLVTLANIRAAFELKWKDLAAKNSLLPYVYFNWDEVGQSDFEKQSIVTISNALVKAIDAVTSNSETKKILFNKLQTLQVSNAPIKDMQIEKQGAFLYLRCNFLRAPSLSIEKELIILLNDILMT
jgi:hypothetical protein